MVPTAKRICDTGRTPDAGQVFHLETRPYFRLARVLDRDERRTFESLIATHGIGPSMAMAILGTHSPRALTDIVANGDTASLTLVPGVGKKTAERLLIELKGRLNLPILDGLGSSSSSSSVAQVREALVGLGYGHDEIRDALRELDSAMDAERLLRDALNLLGSRRA